MFYRRVSNFLLWELAYTELFFADVMWPEFGEEDFAAAKMEVMMWMASETSERGERDRHAPAVTRSCDSSAAESECSDRGLSQQWPFTTVLRRDWPSEFSHACDRGGGLLFPPRYSASKEVPKSLPRRCRRE